MVNRKYMPASLDLKVRTQIYDDAIERGFLPSSAQLSAQLAVRETAVKAALRRLSDAHVLVLEPETNQILMAMPFSAVPTPFIVSDGKFRWHANCSWDAFGVGAMIGKDTVIQTTCACCGERLEVQNPQQPALADDRVVHFAIPVRYWWDDVVFT